MRASIFRALALGGTLGLASVVGGCAAIAGLDKDYVFTGGDDAGATDGDARADAGPSSVAICSANHMFATESMSAECRQALVPNCCSDVAACANSDQGSSQERNCVFAFQACQSKCASDIQLLDCRTCLAGYPAAAQAFAKCAGRLGGICDPKAIEYR